MIKKLERLTSLIRVEFLPEVAAHACSRGWVLITNNEREFLRVPGLVENWVAPASSGR
ncbi:hypothetical protein [Pseudomonas sp. PDM13]|uniref:hypothetical protein n=1 Tax=Pseudomonas sp. PDM13 TaxID=2769255 RepID=UPI0021DF8778|nr:hypothetical protein [Pseudomonas sp. PDM13]MCU9946345.1 hypothetical protein [Pseudomonas sp. PDM13]